MGRRPFARQDRKSSLSRLNSSTLGPPIFGTIAASISLLIRASRQRPSIEPFGWNTGDQGPKSSNDQPLATPMIRCNTLNGSCRCTSFATELIFGLDALGMRPLDRVRACLESSLPLSETKALRTTATSPSEVRQGAVPEATASALCHMIASTTSHDGVSSFTPAALNSGPREITIVPSAATHR